MDIEIPYNWTPYEHQIPVWNHFLPDTRGQRGACVWHRRGGKDLTGINVATLKAHQRVGLYWHLLPTYKQARKVIWNNRDDEGRKFLDYFPPALVDAKHEQEMSIRFRNGSIYQLVGTDDVDKLMGPNPVGCIFSEYALHDPKAWHLIEPILLKNGGWALFISTVRGKNHWYDLWKANKNNPDWFTDYKTIRDTRDHKGNALIPEEEVERARKAGTPEAIIKQELYCDWEAAIEGAIYGEAMDKMTEAKRITKVPWVPQMEVHTYWDLGFGDATVIIWAQHFRGLETRIIDYHEERLSNLPKLIKLVRDKPYTYGNHWAPWDVDHRFMAAEQSLLGIGKTLGFRFRVCPKHHVRDGIAQAQTVFPSLWIDEKKCDRLIEALRSYHYRWDDKLKRSSDLPQHDWASHGADGFRTMCWCMRMNQKPTNLPDRAADYNPPWQ